MKSFSLGSYRIELWWEDSDSAKSGRQGGGVILIRMPIGGWGWVGLGWVWIGLDWVGVTHLLGHCLIFSNGFD